MHCKRCGKALGTDRGICPFCGAMMTKNQLAQYKKDKQENMFKPEYITEKYGEKPVYYEKSEIKENKIIGFIVILGILLALFLITLLFVLNK